MESNKQEKSNLLNDNPIAAQAGGSWISKHMGSPMQMNKAAALYPLAQVTERWPKDSAAAEMHPRSLH